MKASLLLKSSEGKKKALNVPVVFGIKENTRRRILMLFGPTLQFSLFAFELDILFFSTGCGSISSTDALEGKDKKNPYI